MHLQNLELVFLEGLWTEDGHTDVEIETVFKIGMFVVFILKVWGKDEWCKTELNFPSAFVGLKNQFCNELLSGEGAFDALDGLFCKAVIYFLLMSKISRSISTLYLNDTSNEKRNDLQDKSKDCQPIFQGIF